MKKLKSFFKELKRRNIYRVAVVYGITGWVIVQIASIAANTFGAPPWVMKMIITLILLGFPIAMVLTWAFEVTPEGVRKTKPTENETGDINTSSELYFWIGISVMVALLFGGWWYLTMETSTNTKSAISQNITDRSIAVLPLKSVSGSDDPLPLAEGLHDDLLTRLANVGDLKIISRTSVEKFRGTELTLPAIADSLGVKWIVEGNVQKDRNKVEINAKLIDPSTDTPNWTGTYQRDLNAEDVFAIQGAIPREIASALQVQLSLGEQKRITGAPTQNLEAYQLYVKGRQLFHQASNREEQLTAISYYKKSLRRDSTFALAWTGLADAIGAGLFENFSLDSLNLPDVTQREAAQRALKLAPNLAEAHTSMGIVYLEEGNGSAAVKELKKATTLKPSHWEAHNRLGEFYLKTGRPEKALTHLKIVEELNPQHRRARHFLYDAYLITGQAEESLEIARQQKSLGLEKMMAIGGEIRALYVLGKYEQALQLGRQQLESADSGAHFLTFVAGSRFDDYIRSYLVSILAAKGDTAEAKKYLHQLKAKSNASAVPLAIGYASLDKIDKAIENFQKVPSSHWRRIGPSADLRYGHVYNSTPLKSDPRYRELIQEANRAWGLKPDGSFPEEHRTETSNGN